jgi:pyridoxal phosphate-dependent aminotransferase EpsN
MNDRVYLSPPDVGAEERRMLLDAFDSGWIAPLGPHVDAFEAELAARCGRGSCAALSSGTAALHLALLLADVGPGDRVYTSTLTFAATVNAIRYVGATPVLVDVDESWTLDAGLLEEALERDAGAGRLPKAVIPVDLYGQCADYGRVEAACAKHGVVLIEDAAEALGASCGDRPAGSFGRFGVLSFNGNKTITCSSGGALLADDEELASRARFLATQARDPAPHYEHSEVGYNYRLSNLLAAVGRAQLRTLDDKVARRREHNAAYRDALSGLDVAFMPEASWGRCSFWLTTLTFATHELRERVRLALEAENIESRPVWKPMHLQPVFAGHPAVGGEVAADLFARGLCLPSGSSLSDADRARVAGIVRARVGSR